MNFWLFKEKMAKQSVNFSWWHKIFNIDPNIVNMIT